LEKLNNTEPRLGSESWFREHWRPMMAYVYMLICLMDFVGFPLISMFLPAILKTGMYLPWKTLTLESGGMIHMAFGAILGISAWTRGTEKVAEINNRPSFTSETTTTTETKS